MVPVSEPFPIWIHDEQGQVLDIPNLVFGIEPQFGLLALNSRTPCSGCPHPFTIRTYNVRGILIDRDFVVAEMHFLEPVCPKLLDSLPTESRSFLLYTNRVLREVRCNGGRIVLVE